MITFNIEQIDEELTSIVAVTENIETVWAVCKGPVLDEVLEEAEEIARLCDGQILDWR